MLKRSHLPSSESDARRVAFSPRRRVALAAVAALVLVGCGRYGFQLVEECADVDCGAGRCFAMAGVAVCACSDGFQDNDGDLACQAACADNGSSCSSHGNCDDTTGAVVCTCDEGYSGSSCAECGAGYVSDGSECLEAIPLVGGRVPGDPARFADASTAGSCHAYRDPPPPYVYEGNTGDGVYLIDPFGTGPFEVECDMTTGGGGFTYVDAALASASFGVTVTSLRQGTCSLQGVNPRGQDGGDDHLCRFDIELGFEFNEIFPMDFEMTARTSFNSDVSHETSRSWGDAGACILSGGGGDARLGSAADGGVGFSLGGSTGVPPCGGVNLFNNGESMGRFEGHAVTPRSTAIRLEMGDAGPQGEGSEWTRGGAYVRLSDETVVGALTASDPGRYSDDTLATSCAEYFEGRFLEGSFYAASRTGGIYRVDSDGPGGSEPVATACYGGREATLAVDWQRADAPSQHTLSSFLAQHTNELAPLPTGVTLLPSESEQPSHLRWSGNAYGARSYRVDLPGNTMSRVSVELLVAATELAEGGVYVFATGASGAVTNIVCRQGAVSGNTNYTAETLALLPYDCPDPQGELREVLGAPVSRLYGTHSIDIGEPVRAVTFRVLGGTTQVYRWRVYTSR